MLLLPLASITHGFNPQLLHQRPQMLVLLIQLLEVIYLHLLAMVLYPSTLMQTLKKILMLEPFKSPCTFLQISMIQ